MTQDRQHQRRGTRAAAASLVKFHLQEERSPYVAGDPVLLVFAPRLLDTIVQTKRKQDMPSDTSETKLALEAGQNATGNAKGRDIVSSVVLSLGTSCAVLCS